MTGKGSVPALRMDRLRNNPGCRLDDLIAPGIAVAIVEGFEMAQIELAEGQGVSSFNLLFTMFSIATLPGRCVRDWRPGTSPPGASVSGHRFERLG